MMMKQLYQKILPLTFPFILISLQQIFQEVQPDEVARVLVPFGFEQLHRAVDASDLAVIVLNGLWLIGKQTSIGFGCNVRIVW